MELGAGSWDGALALGLVCLQAGHSFPFCQTVHQTTSPSASTPRRGSWHGLLCGCCPGDPTQPRIHPLPAAVARKLDPAYWLSELELPRPSNPAPAPRWTSWSGAIGAYTASTRRREAFSQLRGHVLLAWPAVSCQPLPSHAICPRRGLDAACDGLLQAKQPTAADRGRLSITTARSAQFLSSPSGDWGLGAGAGGPDAAVAAALLLLSSTTTANRGSRPSTSLRGCCLRLDSLSTSLRYLAAFGPSPFEPRPHLTIHHPVCDPSHPDCLSCTRLLLSSLSLPAVDFCRIDMAAISAIDAIAVQVSSLPSLPCSPLALADSSSVQWDLAVIFTFTFTSISTSTLTHHASTQLTA